MKKRGLAILSFCERISNSFVTGTPQSSYIMILLRNKTREDFLRNKWFRYRQEIHLLFTMTNNFVIRPILFWKIWLMLHSLNGRISIGDHL
jgi:hypothetical protein